MWEDNVTDCYKSAVLGECGGGDSGTAGRPRIRLQTINAGPGFWWRGGALRKEPSQVHRKDLSKHPGILCHSTRVKANLEHGALDLWKHKESSPLFADRLHKVTLGFFWLSLQRRRCMQKERADSLSWKENKQTNKYLKQG